MRKMVGRGGAAVAGLGTATGGGRWRDGSAGEAARQGEHLDPGGAGRGQRPAAFLHRTAGGEHVVDQQHPPVAHPLRVGESEHPAQVGAPFPAGELRLRPGAAAPAEPGPAR